MRTTVVILCAFIVGCPSATTTKPAPDPAQDPATAIAAERKALEEKLSALSNEAETLLRDQDELIWKSWTEGAKADISSTYEGHEQLFTVTNIRAIQRYRELAGDGDHQRWLSNLETHFVGEHLARELTEVTDAIANLELSVTFRFEGKDVPYRDLEKLLANESRAERRAAMYAAATPAVQRLAQSWKRKDERVTELLKELGYASYLGYAAELRRSDLERLPILATQVLDVTDAAWKKVLGDLSRRELQADAPSASRAHFPRLFRAQNVDAFFAKEQVLPRAKQTLQGMGLSLEPLRVDEAARKGKHPRALTLPVRVPSDVRLSVSPASGARSQAQALHELGHAMHYAHTRPALRFEQAKLGNDTVAEAMGFVFEDLMEDPVWLEQFAGMSAEKARDYLWTQSAHKLFVVRRAAARILYELALHGPGAPDAKATYAALMTRAYGVPVEGDDVERAGTEREDFLESADDFRAWFLAGQIQGQLKGRFGPSWWNNAESGAFLKTLWAKGNAAYARDVAKQMGEERIKPDVLLLRISSAVQVPITLPAAAPDVETPAVAP